MRNILLLVGFLSGSITAQAQNTFEKIIDTLACASAHCIQETFDGGYVFCGKSDLGGNDVIIVKLDSIGTIEWAKVYGGPSIEGAAYIEQTPDSGYMVNALYDGGSLYAKSWLLRLDINGDTLWTKTFSMGMGATRVDLGNSMASVNNTIYGLTGYFQPVPLTMINAYFMATIGNGFLLSSKIYNTSPFQTGGYAIDNTFDNGFIISAWFATSSSTSDFYLIRTDAYGDTLWTKTYHKSQNDAGFAVEQTSDSGFIVAGVFYNLSTGKYNIYLFKTDSVGDTLWTKPYYSSDAQGVYSIHQTGDGGYILAGDAPNGASLSDIYLIKTDSNGDTLWTRFFGANANDHGYFVQQTKDGGYIICGIGMVSGVPGTYIIKTDSMGNVLTGLGTAEINNPFHFDVFPNPSPGIFTIKAKGISKKNSLIDIYNINSQQVYYSEINNNASLEINLSGFPDGMYMIVLRSNEKIYHKKIIVQK